jgi:uncharacterized protein (TIGR02246 family)
MRCSRLLALTMLLGVTLVPMASGRAAEDEHAADRAAIAKAAEAFVASFQKEDATALANFWVEDGDYVDPDGLALSGRKAIADDFAQMFKDIDGQTLRVEIHSIRFPAPDTAIEDGVTSVFTADGSLPIRMRYTNVMVKRDGQWRLASVRETPYTPPSNYEYLRPLEWLIGDWIQETKDGHINRVVFEWAPERNFIIATRMVGVNGAVLDNGHQRIGWDAASKHLRSWTFEPDGGFAEGAWIKEGDKWVNRVSSVTRTGSLMVSTMVVTRVDADTITCEAKEQVLDGKPVPDAPLITMKRAR